MRSCTLILAVALALLTGANLARADRASVPLDQMIKQADAIVVGAVAEVEAKRYSLAQYKKDTDGQAADLVFWFDLAVLHPEKVLKSDSPRIINKADASYPAGWMHVACFRPSDPPGIDLLPETPPVGSRRIWFLRHDFITGHYFYWNAANATDEKIKEIEQKLAEAPKATKGKDEPTLIRLGGGAGIGIQVDQEGDTAGRISQVAAGFPGAEASLKVGDRIVRIGSDPFDFKLLRESTAALRQGQREEVLLTVERGGQTLEYRVQR